MVDTSNFPSLDELLLAPAFRREEYSAYLFTPYSRKLRRRVYLYTPSGYDLWVVLEADPKVVKFNERVPKCAVAVGVGKAVNVSPIALSIDSGGGVTSHSLSPLGHKGIGSADEIPLAAWEDWAGARGYRHIAWTSESLGSGTTRLESLKRLLRFVCKAGAIPSLLNDEAVLAELKGVRRMTAAKLIEQLPQSDPDELWCSIARLIVDQRVFSDIDCFPLSIVTELSAYRDVTKE